ncbi:glutaminase A [Streptomyces sp. NPDC004111]|uniref:glutaminase A n=1 Tax=Streptomyces sp. NPDC004111 TaxID=3364690 RepID=UPI00367F1F3F
MDPVTDSLHEMHQRLSALREGKVADYIPQLALADPDDFGVALVSMAGHVYRAGKADTPFSIQSVSKPFVYALALSDLGPQELLRHVGVEPSGNPFNAISLEPDTGRPANPMINAGAIATTALVRESDPAARFARIRAFLSAFAGRELDVDEDVYASEAATGDRNRALAYLMHSAGSLHADPEETVDTYFRQCSVRVTATDLAVMAATLANGGRNPVTGNQVVSEPIVVRTLAVMASCGMYDGAGQWLLDIGLPAKSGVSGGLIAASPARFGVAIYSPPLDPSGNPVRAVAALGEVSERFGLHIMHMPGLRAATVTGAERLERDGRSIGVVTAQGSLEFTETEALMHALRQVTPSAPGWVVLDLTAVSAVLRGPAVGLAAVLADLAERGHHVAVAAQQTFVEAAEGRPRTWEVFSTRADALAWCLEGPAPAPQE